MVYLLIIAFCFALALSRIVRCIVFHPVKNIYYCIKDLYWYILHKGWNKCPVGALDIYCGYFGSGKTLSLVHKVIGLYNRYDDKIVCVTAVKSLSHRKLRCCQM